MSRASSLTVVYGTLRRSLVSEVTIAVAFDPAAMQPDQYPPFKKYQGIWDTGATASVITQEVVDELDLKPIGMIIQGPTRNIAICFAFGFFIWLPKSRLHPT